VAGRFGILRGKDDNDEERGEIDGRAADAVDGRRGIFTVPVALDIVFVNGF
jgi:hypothetical protein